MIVKVKYVVTNVAVRTDSYTHLEKDKFTVKLLTFGMAEMIIILAPSSKNIIRDGLLHGDSVNRKLPKVGVHRKKLSRESQLHL